MVLQVCNNVPYSKNFGGEKTLVNLANHNNSSTFLPILLFCNMRHEQKRSCALIVLHKDRGKDIDIAVF